MSLIDLETCPLLDIRLLLGSPTEQLYGNGTKAHLLIRSNIAKRTPVMPNPGRDLGAWLSVSCLDPGDPYHPNVSQRYCKQYSRI